MLGGRDFDRCRSGCFRIGCVAGILLIVSACDVPTFTLKIEPPVDTLGPPVRIAVTDSRGTVTDTELLPRIVRNEIAWKQSLDSRAFAATRRAVEELAYSGEYDALFEEGVFRCIACRTALFASKEKYDSGTGWPSFRWPVAESNVRVSWDSSWGLRRRAVSCVRCGSHLGHVFNDGPPPKRRRYCINSAALAFEPPARAIP